MAVRKTLVFLINFHKKDTQSAAISGRTVSPNKVLSPENYCLIFLKSRLYLNFRKLHREGGYRLCQWQLKMLQKNWEDNKSPQFTKRLTVKKASAKNDAQKSWKLLRRWDTKLTIWHPLSQRKNFTLQLFCQIQIGDNRFYYGALWDASEIIWIP